ncbi:hypothetical protein N7530_007263 [Penicillium desertorum]|uniref:Condensation domain-containing protein n=1 Tax=Penicillium desertorum TaxID=1303715 RepID=A0A9W9WLY2_9EURO|nr:hypothetical protein N7530_007263 [Penicillium desertorum]
MHHNFRILPITGLGCSHHLRSPAGREDRLVQFEHLDYQLDMVRSQLNLLKSDSIEEIYPCSDGHSGVLELYTSNYTGTAIFEICYGISDSNAGEQGLVSTSAPSCRLAWTILMKEPKVHADYLHVVLDKGPAQILALPRSKNALSELKCLEPVKSWGLSPPHRLIISQDHSGTVFTRLETGRALIDAFSMTILLEELSLLLQELLLPFAQSKRLDFFWRSNNLTITNVFQIACAITLAHYTNSRDVCFGTITSGRDMSRLEVWDIVGSFFNILPCRIAINPTRTVMDALQQNQEDIQRRNDNQYCSIPDVVRKSGIRSLDNDQQLFNTILTVQNPFSTRPSTAKDGSNEIDIKLIDLEDATEYDLLRCYSSFRYSPQGGTALLVDDRI